MSEGKAKLNKEFSTSWNPQDVERSANRSRDYAIKTSLAWVTDLVDVYRISIMRLPGAFTAEQLEFINNSEKDNKTNSRSVKLQSCIRVIGEIDSCDLALVQLGIYWRNRIVHSSASSTLDSDVKGRLRKNVGYFKEVYRGLDVELALQAAVNGNAPRFKEVASIIQASHRLVEAMDTRVVSLLSAEIYADSILHHHISKLPKEELSNTMLKIWPGDTLTSERKLGKILEQNGMSRTPAASAILPQSYLEELSKLSLAEAKKRFCKP